VALDEKLGIEIPEQLWKNQYDEITLSISRIKWTNKNPNLEK
jgi:hypothetical protein